MKIPVHLYQGQAKYTELLCVDDTGAPYDLTGCRLFATVRATVSATEPTLTKDSEVAGQITIVDAEAGVARIKWEAADSATRTPRRYSWDVWIVDGDDDPFLIVEPSEWAVALAPTKPSQLT